MCVYSYLHVFFNLDYLSLNIYIFMYIYNIYVQYIMNVIHDNLWESIYY